MPDKGYMDAAAIPDAGDDTLREQLAEALTGLPPTAIYSDGTIKVVAEPVIDALLPIIREHTAAAVRAERERLVTQLELMVRFPASDAPYSQGTADGFNAAVHDLLGLLREEPINDE